MGWKDVGQWLSKKGGSILGLAGAVATGNIPAGIAAVASLVTEATGETDPTAALMRLQTDPATLLKLEELAKANEADIRAHHREMLKLELEDEQKAHETQQETIRQGDTASDEYVRHTRPMMARQSWYATIGYVTVTEAWSRIEPGIAGADWMIASTLLAPAAAYLGFRTFDKVFGKAKT